MTSNCSRRGRFTMKFPCASLGIKPRAPRNRKHPTIRVMPVKRRRVQKAYFAMGFSFFSLFMASFFLQRGATQRSFDLAYGTKSPPTRLVRNFVQASMSDPEGGNQV